MPDDREHKAMWNKLDRHDAEIQNVQRATAILEHRANETDAKILRMLDSSEINQAKTHEILNTMSGTIATIAASNNKILGARDATRYFWPLIISGLGLIVVYTQFIKP